MLARYFAALVLPVLIILVLYRARQLKKLGIKAMRFGKKDKKDFIIPPFFLFFLYVVYSGIFDLPKIGNELFLNNITGPIGVVLCVLGIMLFIYALISFGSSFRVGLDEDHPGELVTKGAFAISRNPIYVAFAIVLTGLFLIIPNWIIIIYVIAAILLFNRQIRLEEESLKKIYGDQYEQYCKKVRRYL